MGDQIHAFNDSPEVRRLFAGFTIDPVPVRYTIAGMGQSKVVGEVIISN